MTAMRRSMISASMSACATAASAHVHHGAVGDDGDICRLAHECRLADRHACSGPSALTLQLRASHGTAGRSWSPSKGPL